MDTRAATSEDLPVKEELKWVPSTVDVTRPSVARMYDYYLGGSHNFEADRAAAKQVEQIFPGIAQSAGANRSFLRRAVRHLVAQGVDQFLDLGSGIPTVRNVHEVAREVRPGARVAYVDVDPIAVTHSRSILGDDPHSVVLHADLTDPERVLKDPELRRMIDFTEPVCVILVAVAHFIADTELLHRVVDRYREEIPAGSYLILSHASASALSQEAEHARQIYNRTTAPLTLRDEDDLRRLLEGWDLVEPGLVPVTRWRPDSPDEVGTVAGVSILSAVARKP